MFGHGGLVIGFGVLLCGLCYGIVLFGLVLLCWLL